MREIKGFLVFSVILLFANSHFSQTSTSSPYSRFGLGEFNSGNTANSMAMGGLSYGLRNDSTAPYHLNLLNPAGLSSLRLTVFDISMVNTSSVIQSSSQKVTANRFALGQMAFGVPMNKYNTWGMAFGLQPFSSSGYDVGSSEEIDSIGTVSYNYQGSGGINELFMANGFRIKNFSFGATVGWLFGGIRSTYRDSFPSSGMYFNTRMVKTVQFSDVYFKGGLQYQLKLGSKWSAVFGATATAPTTLIAKTTTLAELLKFNSVVEIARDTALYEVDVKDTVTMPLQLGGGIVIRKGERILIGLDYFRQDWTGTDLLGQNGRFSSSDRFSLGFQFIPDKYAEGRSNFKKRVQYRAGFKYAHHYLMLNNDTPLTEMAVSFGVGLPMRKMRVGETFTQNILNLSVELGQRGTTESGLVKEQFLRFNIGFSLNEKWFIKRKFD